MDVKITWVEIFLALSISMLLRNDVPERLLSFLLFLLPSSTYCGTFLYIESRFFFTFSPNSVASFFFFKRKFLKILNPACNISAVILVELPFDLFILKLSSYILIPSKENAA